MLVVAVSAIIVACASSILIVVMGSSIPRFLSSLLVLIIFVAVTIAFGILVIVVGSCFPKVPLSSIAIRVCFEGPGQLVVVRFIAFVAFVLGRISFQRLCMASDGL